MQCIHALTRDRECPSQMGHMNQGSLEIVVESTGRVLSVTPPTEAPLLCSRFGHALARCTIPCMGRRASPRGICGPPPPRTKWTRRVPSPRTNRTRRAQGLPLEQLLGNLQKLVAPFHDRLKQVTRPQDRGWRAQFVSTL